MVTCNFCQREFANAQAVRAHLKSCQPYLEQRTARQAPETAGTRLPSRDPRAEGSVGAAPRRDGSRQGELGIMPLEILSDPTLMGADPLRQLDEEIAMTKRRIDLRQLQETEDELDRRAKAKEAEQQRAAATASHADQEKQDARQRELDQRKAREAREWDEARRKQRFRDNITAAKKEAIDKWCYRTSVSSALTAEILVEIEQELSALPAGEMPLGELVRIAIGIRDRRYNEHCQAELDASLRELEEQGLKIQRDQQQSARRQTLIQHGMSYARREIDGVEGLDYFEKRRIEQRVQTELDEVTGEEGRAEIEDWVEDILDREGIGYDDEDDDDD